RSRELLVGFTTGRRNIDISGDELRRDSRASSGRFLATNATASTSHDATSSKKIYVPVNNGVHSRRSVDRADPNFYMDVDVDPCLGRKEIRIPVKAYKRR
ncbi:hypothetical protein J6590_063325, partial [Homalodisca vitripennis]